MARVFIGIPTRNRPCFVREAIRSALAQTAGDFRVVVSDNASDQAAAESVSSFVLDLADSRVHYHLQATNIGEYGQGRFLLGECSEPYFVILHDDDRLELSYLETALRCMEEHRDLASFVANPYIFDAQGVVSNRLTSAYLSSHGRNRRAEGPLDILEPSLRWGFLPISGTLHRTSALRAVGLSDDDCQGNYPFEFNVFLRLGENGLRAYFRKQQLLGFRIHEGALRNTMRLKFNEEVVSTVMKLLERRRFSGRCERLRRRILAYNRRNHAMIRLARGDFGGCYASLFRALSLNPLSYRNWTYSAAAVLFPFLLRPLLRLRVVPAASR